MILCLHFLPSQAHWGEEWNGIFLKISKGCFYALNMGYWWKLKLKIVGTHHVKYASPVGSEGWFGLVTICGSVLFSLV
jgi:hypothetical protein